MSNAVEICRGQQKITKKSRAFDNITKDLLQKQLNWCNIVKYTLYRDCMAWKNVF